MPKKYCISGQELLAREDIKSIIKPVISVAKDKRIYLVGGAIRDMLLDRTPCDFDFAVSGSGVKFAKLFAQKSRGSFVMLSEKDDEARVVKHNITFDFNGIGSKPIYNDLVRRDFTINALAIDLKKSGPIIDCFSGLRHLKAKIIVPVSKNSLILDPLRILRAFRHALELNFKVDKKVLNLTRAINLTDIAPERISYEFLRISENPKSFSYIKLLCQLNPALPGYWKEHNDKTLNGKMKGGVNLLTQIFPSAQELLQNRALTGHSLRTYKMIEVIVSRKSFFSQFSNEFENYFADFPYRRALLKIAGLLHDIAKPHTEFKTEEGDVHFYGHDNLGAKIVQKLAHEKLRLSRKQTQMLKTLIANHMRLHLLATARQLTDRAIRRFFRDLANEYFGLMILTYADGYATAKQTGHLEQTILRMIKLKQTDDAKRKVTRLITGNDLIALGYKPGPIFKPILQELEEMQLDCKITTKQEGVEYVKTHFPLDD